MLRLVLRLMLYELLIPVCLYRVSQAILYMSVSRFSVVISMSLFIMVMHKLVIVVIILFICSAAVVFPQYTRAIQADGLARDEIIEKYFHLELN